MANFWSTEYSSLLVAPQTGGFGVPNTSGPKALLCDKPKFTPATEVQELDLLTGIVGASPERLVGRRSGSLSFSMPMEGFASGYDGTDDPGDAGVIPHWMAIAAAAMGSNRDALTGGWTANDFWNGLHLANTAKQTGAVVSASSTSVDMGGPYVLPGELLLAATSASSSDPQIGWVQELAAGVATLFEASKNVVPGGDNLYGTSTAWMSSDALQPTPLTFIWKGANGTTNYVISDAICESVKMTWESGSVPTVEFSFKCYDYQGYTDAPDGLIVPDAYNRIPNIVGGMNGVATIGGVQTGGLEKCSIEWKVEVKEIKDHNAAQGVGAVVLNKPRLSCTFSVPHLSTDAAYDPAGNVADLGSYKWQSNLERGQLVSVGAYVGTQIGKVWSFLIPAARIVSVPALEDRDSIVAYTLQLEAARYEDDSSDQSTANTPFNSLFRLALG